MKIGKINNYLIHIFFVVFFFYIFFIIFYNNYTNNNACNCCTESNKKENFVPSFGKNFNRRTRLLTALKHPMRKGMRSLGNFENSNINYGIHRIKQLFS